MKMHYHNGSSRFTICGKNISSIGVPSSKTKKNTTCKSCLKIMNKVSEPEKCWIKIKGTDKTWEVNCTDKTLGELITYIVEWNQRRVNMEPNSLHL